MFQKAEIHSKFSTYVNGLGCSGRTHTGSLPKAVYVQEGRWALGGNRAVLAKEPEEQTF